MDQSNESVLSVLGSSGLRSLYMYMNSSQSVSQLNYFFIDCPSWFLSVRELIVYNYTVYVLL